GRTSHQGHTPRCEPVRRPTRAPPGSYSRRGTYPRVAHAHDVARGSPTRRRTREKRPSRKMRTSSPRSEPAHTWAEPDRTPRSSRSSPAPNRRYAAASTPATHPSHLQGHRCTDAAPHTG